MSKSVEGLWNLNYLLEIFTEPCVETTSGRNGKCIAFLQCKEKLDLFKNQSITPQICNRNLKTICCPEVIVITATIKPPNRISQKSKSFKLKYSIDYYFISFFSEFKECEEYSTKIFSTETFYNQFGQKNTKTIDGCGHKHQDLMLGGKPVSGKTLTIDKFVLTNFLIGNYKRVSSHGFDWIRRRQI